MVLRFIILLPSLILTIVLASCAKGDKHCENAGILSTEGCVCQAGFAGETCEIELNKVACLDGEKECENKGTCEEGICECLPWFDGDRCTENLLEQLEGTYVQESNYGGNCFTDAQGVVYTNMQLMTVTDGPNPDGNKMKVHFAEGSFVIDFYSDNGFDILKQPLDSIHKIYGGGRIINGTLQVAYAIRRNTGGIVGDYTFYGDVE